MARFGFGAGVVGIAMTLLVACTSAPPPIVHGPVAPRPLDRGSPTSTELARAADLLREATAAFEAGDLERAHASATQVVERYGSTPSSAPALWILARVAYQRGAYQEATTLAERYAALWPPGSDGDRAARELIESAREWLAEPPARSAVIGAVLPLSGGDLMRRYAEDLLDGIRLAIEAHERTSGVSIELVVLDDLGDPGRAAERVAELEARGAIGVVGPLIELALDAVVRGRRDPDLVIVSPTSPVVPPAPNVYSTSSGDTWGSRRLAEYAAEGGLQRLAILYPSTASGRRQARAFAEAFAAGGGHIVLEMPYDSGTTTFGTPLERILTADPEALFVPAPERDIRQIAPQIAFYGLRHVQVLGGEAWTSDEVMRTVDRQRLEGVIATTPLFRASPDVGWRDFVAVYERTYRRSLETPIPALGYDAARIVLAALETSGPDRGAVARAVALTRDLRGATGIVSVVDGALARRPFLVRIESGELMPAPPADRLREFLPESTVPSGRSR